MIRVALRTILLLATAAASLNAQEVFPGRLVRIEASTLDRRFEGSYLRRDTLWVGDGLEMTRAVPIASITALYVDDGLSAQRGALRGALVGTLLTMVVSAAGDRAVTSNNVAFALGWGSFFGGAIGAFVPTRVWARADPRSARDY